MAGAQGVIELQNRWAIMIPKPVKRRTDYRKTAAPRSRNYDVGRNDTGTLKYSNCLSKASG